MASDPPPTFRESPQNTVKTLSMSFPARSPTDIAVNRVGCFAHFLVVLQKSNCLFEEVFLGTALLERQLLLATLTYLDTDVVIAEESGTFHITVLLHLPMALALSTHRGPVEVSNSFNAPLPLS